MQFPPDAPSPRLCLVEKNAPDQEYGYNLHAERGKDQFVGTVDKGSPADRAGLRMGDRIFAVNGVSIVGESHRKVVERIKTDPMRCELLVIDEVGATWYKDHNINISPTMSNIVRAGEAGRKDKEKPASGSPPPAAWYAPAPPTGKDPVFVAPPPPTEEGMAGSKPKATVCYLEKRGATDEFGFNLHAEKGKGHFIGAVDGGGIGDRAGLRMAQRIVGVNGILVYPSTPHKEVVSLIKKNPLSTTLLVAAEDVDAWYKQHNEAYSFDWADDGARPNGQQHTHHISIFHEEIYEGYDDYDAEAEVHDQAPAAAEEAAKAEEAAAELAPGLNPDGVRELTYPEHEEEHHHHYHEGEEAVAVAILEELVVERAQEMIAEEEAKRDDEHHHHEHHHEEEEHKEVDLMAAVFATAPPAEEKKTPEPAPRKTADSDPRETPVMSPEPALRTSAYAANGHEHGHSNGHNHHSPPEKRDIFDLSAKEAREVLKNQNRRRDPRRLEMSLEEKHRIVSGM